METHVWDYVVVGGGMAADEAVRGIREVDPSGSILMLSEERFPPYDRPPLSKGLWKGLPLHRLWRARDYAQLGVELSLTTRVTRVDIPSMEVEDHTGRRFRYRRLLLATGGEPKRLAEVPMGRTFRTLDDYLTLRRHAEEDTSAILLGGSFLGAELAAALAQQGRKVTMVFPEEGILSRVLPAGLSAYVTRYYEEHGVEVYPGDTVEGARQEGAMVRAHTSLGRDLAAHEVWVAVGIRPRDELAAQAGLPCQDGIVVDETGRTQAAHVYAAGDVARLVMGDGGERVRLEHEDHAVAHGRLVGRNLAGAGEAYRRFPLVYSDLFDLGFEAVGQLDSSLETFEDWAEPYQKGVVYYLDGQSRVVGVLNWNVWDQVDRARELLASGSSFPDRKQLRGVIPLT